jgi:hypothetical protein
MIPNRRKAIYVDDLQQTEEGLPKQCFSEGENIFSEDWLPSTTPIWEMKKATCFSCCLQLMMM